MKRRYALFSGLAVLIFAVMVLGPQAYADSTDDFNNFIQALHTHRAQMILKFGVGNSTYPHATSYYDDLIDHYEQTMLMSDVIDKPVP